jgi:micrococcal nuclease
MGLLHPGERVALRADPGQANRDRYGRALRYVTLPGGRDYSVLAAREGMAQPYVYHHDPVGEADRIAAAARQARHHDRGLWGPPCNGDVGPGTHPEAHGAHRGH